MLCLKVTRGCCDHSLYWCLLFVLIRQGLRGGSGPQRWIRALGEETGNPIMAFHRPSFYCLGGWALSKNACPHPLRCNGGRIRYGIISRLCLSTTPTHGRMPPTAPPRNPYGPSAQRAMSPPAQAPQAPPPHMPGNAGKAVLQPVGNRTLSGQRGKSRRLRALQSSQTAVHINPRMKSDGIYHDRARPNRSFAACCDVLAASPASSLQVLALPSSPTCSTVRRRTACTLSRRSARTRLHTKVRWAAAPLMPCLPISVAMAVGMRLFLRICRDATSACADG